MAELTTLASLVADLEADEGWREPMAFARRADAMDRLDLYLVGASTSEARDTAERLIEAMEAVDRSLFDHLRERIRRGEGAQALSPWIGLEASPGQHYDALDALLAGVLAIDAPAIDETAPPPEMVFYQPSPARHIVDGVRRAAISAGDVVMDLGSGLGHVSMLVHVLTGAGTRGVERQPSYVDSATRAALALGLSGVSFATGDARQVDLAGVDVFYLFTPFLGTVLRDVLLRIEAEAASRSVRVVVLGPCARTFARMPWLRSDDPDPAATDRIVVFRSSS
ncbi:MAG TPA: hypothetical protein VM621_02430 [Luteibacter sp.]|uniref:hypothetical protein n=1 Tax=Luteibacter sp. TaxID=1886636 RepID=UPI002BBF5A3F|nr:hypothetical protein [Luteibacter sp.]HVI53893.1 hypothetical protein [Luteibacter sp.]